ncbi:MAG: hypothetical protein BWY77_00417 [bacterium ADurb.Bin431]|nr:MAG: hypothetical protein BWY77_00417 [bacterium ADurb.Bin431]
MLSRLLGLIPARLDRAAKGGQGEHTPLVAADRIEDHPLELADIAGKGVVGKQGIEFPGRRDPAPVQLCSGLVEEMVDQQGDVLAALAQGRQGDMVGFQPVIEVLAEALALLQIIAVAQGGDRYACVGGSGLVGAEGIVLALLQKPQQLDLGFETEVADLVEEEGSARRLFDQPLAFAVGPGKGPAAVAEEGVGEKMVIHPGDVQGDKIAFAAAQIMEGAGDQLLARAGLAGDQHRQGRRGDGLDILKDAAHGRAVGDDGGEAFGMFQARGDQVLPEFDVLVAHLAQLQRPGHQCDQAGVVDGLDRIIKGPRLDGLDHPFHLIDRGDDDDRDVGKIPHDQFEQLLPRQVRHHHVEDDDRKGLFRQHSHGLAAVLTAAHIVDPLGDQGVAGTAQKVFLVIDEEHRPFGIEC